MRSLSLTPELVARCYRVEQDPGPTPGFTHLTSDELQQVANELHASRPEGPLWVFAYGSLLWSPEFAATELRYATALGWHRSFCMELMRWRGTPELPGLMMALAAGGRCNGVIQRVPEGEEALAIHKLVLREISVAEDIGMARWIRVRDQESTKTALVFWAGPKGLGIVHGLPLEVVAWRLAHACGHYGSSAEYLYNTVVKLEEHGIQDRNLWQLQEMVADIVKAWPIS